MRSVVFFRSAGSSATLLLLTAAAAQAQGSYSGSIYSRYGLGERASTASAQGAAMGGGGIGLVSLSYVQVGNPATLAEQILTRATAGAYVQTLDAEDGAGRSGRRAEGVLTSVEFAFPIVRQRVGVGLRFLPTTRVAYGASRTGQLVTPESATGDDTLRYRVAYQGSGGVNTLDGGVGVALGAQRNILLGASVGVRFGLIEDGRRTTFVSASGNALSAYAEQNAVTTTRVSGVTGTVGAVARFDSLGGTAGRRLNVGATLTLPTRLSGRRTLTLGESLDRDTLATSAKGSMTMPLEAAVGIAFSPSPRWTTVLDARYEPWGAFESDFALPGYGTACPSGQVCTTPTASTFSDRIRVSGGFEFLPAGNSPFASFWRRTAYRLGAYVDRGYVAAQDDQTLTTVAVTGGLSFPSLLFGSRADLNAEVGQRGEATGALVRDRYVRLGLVFSFGERWFDRPRLR